MRKAIVPIELQHRVLAIVRLADERPASKLLGRARVRSDGQCSEVSNVRFWWQEGQVQHRWQEKRSRYGAFNS